MLMVICSANILLCTGRNESSGVLHAAKYAKRVITARLMSGSVPAATPSRIRLAVRGI